MIINTHELVGASNLRIVRELIREALKMPQGTKEVVYFDSYNNRLGFSEPFTAETSPDDPFKIGELGSLDLENVDCAKEINDNFVEIDDRSSNTDPDFHQDDYVRYYSESSIVKKEKAQEYISRKALLQSWYDDILHRIE
jgi:hypothetical protein